MLQGLGQQLGLLFTHRCSLRWLGSHCYHDRTNSALSVSGTHGNTAQHWSEGVGGLGACGTPPVLGVSPIAMPDSPIWGAGETDWPLLPTGREADLVLAPGGAGLTPPEPEHHALALESTTCSA